MNLGQMKGRDVVNRKSELFGIDAWSVVLGEKEGRRGGSSCLRDGECVEDHKS